jgi:hypothetical protein
MVSVTSKMAGGLGKRGDLGKSAPIHAKYCGGMKHGGSVRSESTGLGRLIVA